MKIPTSPTAGTVERWWNTVRGLTLKQVPLESALSYPIPIVEDDKLCYAVFYYRILRHGNPKDSRAGMPIARVVATYPEGRLLIFEHQKAADLFPDIPPREDLGRAGPAELMSTSDLMAARREYFLLCEEIGRRYFQEKSGNDSRLHFLELFKQLTEAGLEPYYRALSPQFFAWLEEV